MLGATRRRPADAVQRRRNELTQQRDLRRHFAHQRFGAIGVRQGQGFARSRPSTAASAAPGRPAPCRECARICTGCRHCAAWPARRSNRRAARAASDNCRRWASCFAPSPQLADDRQAAAGQARNARGLPPALARRLARTSSCQAAVSVSSHSSRPSSVSRWPRTSRIASRCRTSSRA